MEYKYTQYFEVVKRCDLSKLKDQRPPLDLLLLHDPQLREYPHRNKEYSSVEDCVREAFSKKRGKDSKQSRSHSPSNRNNMPTTLQAKERKKQRKTPSMADLDRAWDAAISSPPKYTMRQRTSFGAQIKAKMAESDITSGPIDIGKSRPENPKWSMRARTCKMLQLPGMSIDSVPGPGTYPVPSTTDFSHPALKMPGRTKFGTAPRFKEPESD